ncbi:DnaJ C-terminal domain-containing protein [Opitutus sp. GAS368]|uniref:DnaJ C-terminal domain-containing protein n=1 Tax=Opitutus sp. GAS368 TaxID=1882749 RepID=UPI00087BF611|nr:DnaJ C-terminal domain-containing protein [Opitutus sp. GAS368]SDR66719.1 curved DNA-binding protein [Opitutus sp. GAS368]
MAVKFQDYYAILGVDRTAPAEEIKLAFRKLARIHHPDVAQNKVAGEAKFKEINEAYEVLGDPEKRKRYDELGPEWAAGGGSPGRAHPPGDEPDFEFGGTGFSDFFESFFSGRPGGFGSARGPAPADGFVHPGRDIEADLLVTLEEALRGSSRQVTLRRPAMDGGAERTNTYQVRIPPGMREGQRIHLAAQGGPGSGGAPAGDLYLRVRFARHPDLRVQDDDLHCDLDLAPWEAVLGVKAAIPSLGGTLTLRVSPGTTAGTQLRVRGQGLPRENGSRGELFATVRLQVPATVSAEERALWEKLAATSPFNPRKPL